MSQEVIQNKALSGTELREIVMKDLGSMLDQDGMLAMHIAYGRVGYEITVKFHTNRPVEPTWQNRTTSRKATVQELELRPGLGLDALDSFPLKDAEEDAVAFGLQRTREITSPNLTRIQEGLPIAIAAREADGEVKEKDVMYSLDDLPAGMEKTGVVDRELSADEVLAK